MAEVQPMAPKKGCIAVLVHCPLLLALPSGCENSLVAKGYIFLGVAVNLRRRRGFERWSVSFSHSYTGPP